jgi:hypothetical protein
MMQVYETLAFNSTLMMLNSGKNFSSATNYVSVYKLEFICST